MSKGEKAVVVGNYVCTGNMGGELCMGSGDGCGMYVLTVFMLEIGCCVGKGWFWYCVFLFG
jgi:hypothetical protein